MKKKEKNYEVKICLEFSEKSSEINEFFYFGEYLFLKLSLVASNFHFPCIKNIVYVAENTLDQHVRLIDHA